MGNCCSDVAGGQSAVGGTGINQGNPANAPNEAVDAFLKSRGYQGLYSQIEDTITSLVMSYDSTNSGLVESKALVQRTLSPFSNAFSFIGNMLEA